MVVSEEEALSIGDVGADRLASAAAAALKSGLETKIASATAVPPTGRLFARRLGVAGKLSDEDDASSAAAARASAFSRFPSLFLPAFCLDLPVVSVSVSKVASTSGWAASPSTLAGLPLVSAVHPAFGVAPHASPTSLA